jgi:hypothetical protein
VNLFSEGNSPEQTGGVGESILFCLIAPGPVAHVRHRLTAISIMKIACCNVVHDSTSFERNYMVPDTMINIQDNEVIKWLKERLKSYHIFRSGSYHIQISEIAGKAHTICNAPNRKRWG